MHYLLKQREHILFTHLKFINEPAQVVLVIIAQENGSDSGEPVHPGSRQNINCLHILSKGKDQY